MLTIEELKIDEVYYDSRDGEKVTLKGVDTNYKYALVEWFSIIGIELEEFLTYYVHTDSYSYVDKVQREYEDLKLDIANMTDRLNELEEIINRYK